MPPHARTTRYGRLAAVLPAGRGFATAERGEGIYVWDAQGKKYLDACGGAFCASIGHGDKRVAAAAARQFEKISFAYRTQFENAPARALAERIVESSPDLLDRVFLVHSGSEAVESAIKLARQYWHAQGRTEKSLIVSRRPGYHGSTLGALALTSYVPLNAPFEPMTVPSPKISAPFCYRCPRGQSFPSCGVACADELEETILKHGPENIAAFITEPVGGASTGGAVPPDAWFPKIQATCRKYDILLIVDEVLTGCGRTGRFYAFEHWGVEPDIVALAKGLAGGYAPVGACVARREVVEPVLAAGGFMHGHTTAGNPLTSAIALEVLRIVEDDRLIDNVNAVGPYLHAGLEKLKDRHAIIGDVRGIGLLAGVEFVQDRETHTPFPAALRVCERVTAAAKARGLLVYPRRSIFGVEGDHVSLAPPLNIDRAGIDEIISLLDGALTDVESELDKET